jgi:hypothetical protein
MHFREKAVEERGERREGRRKGKPESNIVRPFDLIYWAGDTQKLDR